jgi:hypothetical protein
VADWDQFDYAFTCPPGLDEDLQLGYKQMLEQYRAECAGLDMSTVAILRVGTLASQYVRHLNTSRKPYGSPEGFVNPAMEKNSWLAWLNAAREHDEYVTKLRSRQQAQGNVVPAETVSAIVVNVLSRITDAALRARLQDQFVEEMERAGI